jgi:histidinol-phosphate aminotransferase
MFENDAGDARRLWNRKTKRLVPYVPGEQPRDRTFIKLNTNENPYPPPPEVISAIRSYPVERLRLYPDPASHLLRRKLADYFGVDENRIFVGNGSDEILAFAFQAFFPTSQEAARAVQDGTAGSGRQLAPPGETVAVSSENTRDGLRADQMITFPDITYSFYPVYAESFDIPYRLMRLDDDFVLPLAACLEPSAGVVLANPNAPTGIAVGLDSIAAIADADRNRLVLVDEAYVDFGAESAVQLLDRFDNILVVQTCSKSRSLAGLRVGFAIGAPGLIEGLERMRDSFNSYTVDSLAQVAAIAAFDASSWFEQMRGRIATTREKTTRAMRELGFQVLPSCANFVFARHPGFVGAELYRMLRQTGILVRHFQRPRIEDFLRISIGTDDEMDQLIAALAALLA